jgi:hypothetical protein
MIEFMWPAGDQGTYRRDGLCLYWHPGNRLYSEQTATKMANGIWSHADPKEIENKIKQNLYVTGARRSKWFAMILQIISYTSGRRNFGRPIALVSIGR